MPKSVKAVNIYYSQDSVEKRHEKVRGFMCINQLETLYVVTDKSINLTERKHLHFPDTNRGNILGPVCLDKWEDESVWKLKVMDKKLVFGKNGKIMVGGALEGGVDGADAKKPKVFEDGPEPVFWHATPEPLDEELAHSHELIAIINLTVGSASFAMTAIRRHMPYAGVCLTATHVSAVYAYLEERVFKAMQDPQDKLYQQGLRELIDAAEDGKSPPAAGKKPAVGDPDGQPGAKKKKGTPTEGSGGKPAAVPTPSKNMTRDQLMQKISDLTGGQVVPGGGKPPKSPADSGDEAGDDDDA